jgi:hypothetical protein
MEKDISVLMTFLEGKIMELSKLFGNIFLGKFPIAHEPLRGAQLQDAGKAR